MKNPNFLVVGAAKAGTTSVYKYLMQHPEIYCPSQVKESFFFAKNSPLGGTVGPDYGARRVRTWHAYQSLFQEASSRHKAIGEVCVAYLFFHEQAIPQIRNRLGEPRVLIVLRDPVERAFSNYLHHVRDGYEPKSFERALELEATRAEEGYWWGYRLKQVGLYAQQVASYVEIFPEVQILFYEDLVAEPADFMRKIYSFLGVDTSFQPDLSQRHNASDIPTWSFQRRLLNSSRTHKKMAKALLPRILRGPVRSVLTGGPKGKPAMSPGTERALRRFYREDLGALQRTVRRDLSPWREGAAGT